MCPPHMMSIICIGGVVAFFARVAMADVPPTPQPFTGRCVCSLACTAAFKTTAANDLSTTNATYTFTFKTSNTSGVQAPSEEADRRCEAEAEIKRGLPTIARDATLKELLVRYCTNGAEEVGACSNSASECTATKIHCVGT